MQPTQQDNLGPLKNSSIVEQPDSPTSVAPVRLRRHIAIALAGGAASVCLPACTSTRMFAMTSPDQSNQDAQAIAKVMADHYLPAMDSLKFSDFEPAFHPNAHLYFIANDNLVDVTLAQWSSRLDQLRADPNAVPVRERSEKHFAILAQTSTTASVQVNFTFPSLSYVDYLSMVKFAGRWQIISKTFHFST
jgi:Putative lumazine-binding